MEIVEGFLCVGRNKRVNILFGMPISTYPKCYENFQTNGLLPYSHFDPAREGLEEIKRIPNIIEVKVKKIKMEISRDERDLDDLRQRRSLIVISYRQSLEILFGPIEKYPHEKPYPGEPLYFNGLKTFDSFDDAMYLSCELSRQTKSLTRVSSFELGSVE